MRFVSHFALLACVSIGMSVACHTARADAPRPLTPTIDIDVEDRAPDKSSHVTHLSLSLLDGHAQLSVRDGDASYALEATTHDPQYVLKLKRSGPGPGGNIEVESAIATRAGARVLVAKMERADGNTTSVIAQVR